MTIRRAGIVAALAAAPVRPGLPVCRRSTACGPAIRRRARRSGPRPISGSPSRRSRVPTTDGLILPGWFIPAAARPTAAGHATPGPGVALVHGWESARDRLLPMVQFLHAAGFHCLSVDVRGHGANAAETLPITAGEFGADALAAWRALVPGRR